MSHPLSYSILNTSRHPRLPAVTWENSDRLRTFKDFRQKLHVWQREKDGTEKKKRENKWKGDTWTQSEAQVTTKCRGHNPTLWSSGAQRYKETKSSCHCSSSSGGRTISRQAGLRSLHPFDTVELRGIFLFQLPNYLAATQWSMAALLAAIIQYFC